MRHLKLAMLDYGTNPRGGCTRNLTFTVKTIQATEHQFRNIILNKVERGVSTRYMYAPLDVMDMDLHVKLKAAVQKHVIAELTHYNKLLEELDGQV